MVEPGAVGPVTLWATTVPRLLPLAWLVCVTLKPSALSCLVASEAEIPLRSGTLPLPEPLTYFGSVGGITTGPKPPMIGLIAANQVLAGSAPPVRLGEEQLLSGVVQIPLRSFESSNTRLAPARVLVNPRNAEENSFSVVPVLLDIGRFQVTGFAAAAAGSGIGSLFVA